MGWKVWLPLALVLALALLFISSLLTSSRMGEPPRPCPRPVGAGASPAPNGTWATHAPRALKLQETGTVTLFVKQRLSAAGVRVLAFAAAGSNPGATDSGEVVVTSKMAARLAGVAFKIESASPAEQSTGERGSASWTWQVQPQSAGSVGLRLTLSAIDDQGAHVVLDRELPVSVTN